MPKKTVDLIISSGSDYVIPVKENQPLLRASIINITETNDPSSTSLQEEKVRDRQTTRKVSVFQRNKKINHHWKSVKTVIKVERNGTRGGKPYDEVVYYISSLELDADKFASGIRGHWSIENSLHYVKDVIFYEDHSLIAQINAATNLSIITTIAINLLRNDDHSSMTKAIRQYGDDWYYLKKLVG